MTFETFLFELSEHYGVDGTAPGVITSFVYDKKSKTYQHYAAVHAFPDGTVQSRKIVARTMCATLGDCLMALYTRWKQVASCEVAPLVEKLPPLRVEGYADPGVEAIDAACDEAIDAACDASIDRLSETCFRS